MTYRELYEKAFNDLEFGDINSEEFEKRVKPLNQEPTSAIEELEKIKNGIEEIKILRINPYNNQSEYSVSTKELRELLDNHISELKGE